MGSGFPRLPSRFIPTCVRPVSTYLLVLRWDAGLVFSSGMDLTFSHDSFVAPCLGVGGLTGSPPSCVYLVIVKDRDMPTTRALLVTEAEGNPRSSGVCVLGGRRERNE